VIVPYTKRAGLSGDCSRVPRDTWNPVGIWEDHLPRLNTRSRPIVNKYREGKVKVPQRGDEIVPEPCAYKQWEDVSVGLPADV